jgi:hypothetical protein
VIIPYDPRSSTLAGGLLASHDKMFMIEGVVLNSPSAMPELVTASLPSRCSPEEPKKPRPPVGASSLSGQGGCSRSWHPKHGSLASSAASVSGLGISPKESPAAGPGFPPFQAYDFPSRTRESECVNASLASVAILRRLKGTLEKVHRVTEKSQEAGWWEIETAPDVLLGPFSLG